MDGSHSSAAFFVSILDNFLITKFFCWLMVLLTLLQQIKCRDERELDMWKSWLAKAFYDITGKHNSCYVEIWRKMIASGLVTHGLIEFFPQKSQIQLNMSQSVQAAMRWRLVSVCASNMSNPSLFCIVRQMEGSFWGLEKPWIWPSAVLYCCF